MGKFIVIFSDQVNDVEINGFSLMSDKDVELLEDLSASITWDFTYLLEDKVELSYSSGYEYLMKLTFKEISNDEYKTLKKVFGTTEFGVFLGINQLVNIIEDEESEEIDDEDDSEENNDYID